MKRPLKIALIGGGVLVVLWIAALVALSFLFPPAKVKAIVLERAGQILHREISLGSASLRVFPFPGVSLREFSVANNPDSGFSKEPLVSLKSLDVKLSLMSVLKFSPVVKEIVLREPRIRLEILADGRTSLDGLGGPKDTTAPKTDSVKALELPFPLSVERFAIENGSVAYVDRKGKREIVLGSIEQSASFSTDKTLENAETKGDLTISDISVSGEGLPVRKGGIKLQVTHEIALNLPGAKVDIKEIKAKLQDVGVRLSGTASNILVVPDLDLAFGTDGAMDLKKLLAEVPKDLNPALSKLAIEGAVEADFHAKGKVSPNSVPLVDGSIHVRGFGASVAGLPAKLTDVKSAIHVVATQSVVIDSTSWLLNAAPGSLELAVDSLPVPPNLKRKPVLRRLLAQGKVDLEAFAQVFAPLLPILDSLKPSGILGWKVAGNGRLDPANQAGLQIQGDATMEQVSAHLTGISDRPVVNGTGSLSNASAGAKIDLKMGPTDLSVDAKVADWLALVMPKLAEGKITSVQVAAKSKFIDVDKFLPPPDTNPKAPTELPEMLPELPVVNLTATFDADLIQAMGLKVTRVSAKTTLSGGQFLENMTGTVAQGGIVQSLKADLRNRKLLDLSLDTKLTGVQIHDVLVGVKDRLPEGTPRKFHDKLYGKGNATVSARVKAPIREASKKLSADIVGSFVDGKVVNFPALASMLAKAHKLAPSIPAASEFAFSTMSMKAQLVEGKILLQDLQMDGSSLGMVQANGSVGVDQSLDLKVDTHLPDAASSAMQSGAGAAVAATGPVAAALGMNTGSPLPTDDKKRVVLSWLVTGSFADPSVSYNLPRIQDLAKGAAAALANEAKAKAEAFAKEQTDKLKAEAEARARSEAAKVKAEAEKKATEIVKEKAGEQGAKAVDALKKKVKLPW
jgi:hypothetical protein